MKIIILISLLLSCNSKSPKKWLLKIKLQGQTLYSLVKLEGNKGKLFNSEESLNLNKDHLGYKIDSHYSHLEFNKDKTAGYWVRRNKKKYRVPFEMVPYHEKDLFSKYESKECTVNINGSWRIQLTSTKEGLGIFKQEGCRVKGSILTETGDYRYLDGYIENNQLNLQGFDGVFAFIFKLKINGNQLKGKMYAGKDYNQSIHAIRDENFKLKDPTLITKIKQHKSVNLKFQDIEGKVIDFSKPPYNSRPKIITIFGSWCPNCLDEASFLNKWLKNNKPISSKIQIISLAFEKFETKSKAIGALKKLKAQKDIRYPIILVDYNGSVKASDILPINKLHAYPTTLFLNKQNKIIKIHTGFSGQATGPFYEQFLINFTKVVNKLIN